MLVGDMENEQVRESTRQFLCEGSWGICNESHSVRLDVTRLSVRRGRPPARKETSSVSAQPSRHIHVEMEEDRKRNMVQLRLKFAHLSGWPSTHSLTRGARKVAAINRTRQMQLPAGSGQVSQEGAVAIDSRRRIGALGTCALKSELSLEWNDDGACMNMLEIVALERNN